MNKVQGERSIEEMVCIVDGQDNLLDTVHRSEMRDQGLLHRVTYLLVFNSDGELLVQTRTAEKDWYPGRLDLAAGGVMIQGEDYVLSAQRELKEELGIDNHLEYAFKVYFEDNQIKRSTRSWGSVYCTICDGPFNLQPEEVAKVEFMSLKEVQLLPKDKITPDTYLVFKAYLMSRK